VDQNLVNFRGPKHNIGLTLNRFEPSASGDQDIISRWCHVQVRRGGETKDFTWGGFNFVSLMVVGFIGMAELSCEYPGGDSIDGNSIGTGDHFLALVVEC
jgi:hypothetical protein